MNDINRMIGHPDQLYKVRRITFNGGVSDGIRAIELMNSDGFYATCIEEQCLNIYDFSYKGINCAFLSKNGLVANRFFNGGCGEFNYYWPAGMFHTCGLTNTGAPVTENGRYYTEHGRIGMMNAENVIIRHTDDAVVITGDVYDRILCGHQLRLHRTLTFPKRGKQLQIRDEVTNLEGIPTEMMILYHCNFGYPLLTPDARLIKGKGTAIDNLAGTPVPEDYWQMEAPRDHKNEQVFCHTNTPDEHGFGSAAIINDELSLGCYVKYKLDTLPYMLQWKNMCAHDYVVGLEPSNCYSRGRAAERENGTLPVIGAYETKVFELTIGILDGAEEIRQFEALCDK